MPHTPPINVMTFGCRLNTLESEAMKALAERTGVEDTVVINTCAVTQEAVRQARQTIRRTRRERPDARIVVTGCAAQIDPDGFAAMDDVDVVAGNAEKLSASFWESLGTEAVAVGDIMRVRDTAEHLVDGFAARTRAFVEVQNGCDHRCTFCIIPYGRGPSRSVPMGRAVDQVKRLVEGGHREVVLTGVDLTSYGPDLPGAPRLGDLVAAILTHVPDLPRLRLSSIDSIEADERLLDVFSSEERLMPHLHLSLQAGDDMVLKRMKRRHSRADAVRFCDELRARRPGVVFGADLIAGFPTETDAMFANTERLIEECGLSHVHVFPFSPRPGTPAARMPQVSRQVVKARAAALRERATRAMTATLERHIGQRVGVLVEGGARGRTEHYLPAVVASGTGADIVQGTVTGIADGALVVAGDGKALERAAA